MSDLKINTYPWQTGVQEVVAAVEFVARSKAPLVEFGMEGNAAAAAREAADFGWLEFVANGVVQITQTGRHLAMEKDPVGMAMNTAAIRKMLEVRV